jgi:hypothetical protein
MNDRKNYLLQIAQLAQSYGFVPIGVNGKIPRFRNWQNVRYDPDDPQKNIRRISHLYDSNLVNNIAILTGEPSGIVVIDVDVPSLPWWNELVRINGGLPETFTVMTPSGGFHYYFKYTPQVNQLGNMNKIIGQSIDYRTNGGIIIFPGSTSNDRFYTITSGYHNAKPLIAEMPNWLLNLLKYNQTLRS